MKALTIWEPYASAIAKGLKKFETRSWATKHRGALIIHSSIKPVRKECLDLAQKYNIDISNRGKIILVADLVDCIKMTAEFINQQPEHELAFGNWQIGRYAWKYLDRDKQGAYVLPS